MGTAESWHGEITKDGVFKAEKDRYLLYVGLFCPFASRANTIRCIKGLQDIIPICVVKPYPLGNDNGYPGWPFVHDEREYPKAFPDPIFNARHMSDVYFKADPEYKGRYSVPVLWDKKSDTIVNNESAELLRSLSYSFNDLLRQHGKHIEADIDLYPEHLRERIDKLNEWVQTDLNAGVYKAGFAPDQEAYDKNVVPVFAALNKLEKLIHNNGGPFVLGEELTEIDVRLFVTLVRFDPVYVQHFMCNLGTIRDNYPVLNNYMKGLYWGKTEMIMSDGTKRNCTAFGPETVDFMHIKDNYFKSHPKNNPKCTVPKGPWPHIEEGYIADWSSISVGGVKLPEVLEHESALPDFF